MVAVTVDKIGLEHHKRFAIDQVQGASDSAYLDHATSVAGKSQHVGTDAIYTSEHEALFGLDVRSHTFADFPELPIAITGAHCFHRGNILPSLKIDEADFSPFPDSRELTRLQNLRTLIEESNSILQDAANRITRLQKG